MIGAIEKARIGNLLHKLKQRHPFGGGKGTVPTTDRIIQLLDLSQSAIKQPVTKFYLKDEYNNEDSQELANFCSTLFLDDVVKVLPSPRKRNRHLYDAQVIDNFD